MTSYRIERLKQIADEYNRLVAMARNESTKQRLRRCALHAVETVQIVDDYLNKLGVR